MKSILQYMGWRRIALEALRRDGIVNMPPFPEKEFDEILNHIKTDELITAPWFFEMSLSMYDIARNYFKSDPYLCSMTKEIIPAGIRTKSLPPFQSKEKILVIMVYGTDVKITTDGALVYYTETHRTLDTKARPETILGPAGTLFLFDPAGAHVCLEPSKDQLVLRSTWQAVPYSPENLDASTPSLRDVLGKRYPRSPVLQKAVSHVVH